MDKMPEQMIPPLVSNFNMLATFQFGEYFTTESEFSPPRWASFFRKPYLIFYYHITIATNENTFVRLCIIVILLKDLLFIASTGQQTEPQPCWHSAGVPRLLAKPFYNELRSRVD